jgi:hypothetical protein
MPQQQVLVSWDRSASAPSIQFISYLLIFTNQGFVLGILKMVAGLYWKIRRASYIFKGIEETTAFRYFARCKEISSGGEHALLGASVPFNCGGCRRFRVNGRSSTLGRYCETLIFRFPGVVPDYAGFTLGPARHGVARVLLSFRRSSAKQQNSFIFGCAFREPSTRSHPAIRPRRAKAVRQE